MQNTKELVDVAMSELAIKFDPQAEQKRLNELSRRDDALRRCKVEELRAAWGAPVRHAESMVNFSGEWATNYNAIHSKLSSGLLYALVGGRGTGKTQMAVELMRCVTGALRPAKFITATDFFIRIKGTYRNDATEKEGDILKVYQRPSLLVVDEIGKRGESEWENNLLFELINRRYNDKTDTIIIDNRSSAEFTQAIGPSLASRMVECGGIIECNWKSFRG